MDESADRPQCQAKGCTARSCWLVCLPGGWSNGKGVCGRHVNAALLELEAQRSITAYIRVYALEGM